MNMDNISFCFNFFKINMDICYQVQLCIQVHKRSWHILTIWTILLTVYQFLQDQNNMDNNSLSSSSFKIKMDRLTAIACFSIPSPYERSWHILLEKLLNVSLIIHHQTTSGLTHFVACNSSFDMDKYCTSLYINKSMAEDLTHFAQIINVWNSQ